MDDSFGGDGPTGAHEASWSQAGTQSCARRAAGSEAVGYPIGGSGPRERSALIRVIEGEIIPRLFLAHHEPSSPNSSPSGERYSINTEKLDCLAQHALRGDAGKILDELVVLRENGAKSETIYCVLFAPLSRNILNIYEHKLCTFEEMVLGICLIDRLLRDDSHFAAPDQAGPFRHSDANVRHHK